MYASWAAVRPESRSPGSSSTSVVGVCVLESGGFEFEEDTQSLYVGPSVGTVLNHGAPYLRSSRLRFFGGSTNHWAGWCRPLDANDFEKRDWVADNGWPFPKSELDPYYGQAAELCQLQRRDESSELEGRPWFPRAKNSRVLVKRIRFSPPTCFGKAYRAELVQAENVHLFLHANVVDIVTNREGSAVAGLEVKSLKGKALRVEANVFVLAAGGIENARLLLFSDTVQRQGLGNDHDLVGKFFMEHPHLVAGSICITRGGEPVSAGGGGLPSMSHADHWDELMGNTGRSRSVFCTSARVQREHRLLNFSVEPQALVPANVMARLPAHY
jgi:choline dehydrogenase-like flavoprotein